MASLISPDVYAAFQTLLLAILGTVTAGVGYVAVMAGIYAKAWIAQKIEEGVQKKFEVGTSRSIASAAATAKDLGTEVQIEDAVKFFKEHWPDLYKQMGEKGIASSIEARMPSPESDKADKVVAAMVAPPPVVVPKVVVEPSKK